MKYITIFFAAAIIISCNNQEPNINSLIEYYDQLGIKHNELVFQLEKDIIDKKEWDDEERIQQYFDLLLPNENVNDFYSFDENGKLKKDDIRKKNSLKSKRI